MRGGGVSARRYELILVIIWILGPATPSAVRAQRRRTPSTDPATAYCHAGEEDAARCGTDPKLAGQVAEKAGRIYPQRGPQGRVTHRCQEVRKPDRVGSGCALSLARRARMHSPITQRDCPEPAGCPRPDPPFAARRGCNYKHLPTLIPTKPQNASNIRDRQAHSVTHRRDTRLSGHRRAQQRHAARSRGGQAVVQEL